MLKGFILILLLSPLANCGALAQEGEQEASLKAAFIYNFTRYIEWEDADSETEFSIGIIGTSALDVYLDKIAAGSNVNNKKIIIRHFNKPEEIKHCNILFIPQKTSFPLASILNKVGRGMLTVSEETGFAREGTAFNFILVNDKLKFEANLKAIYSVNLKASSQLLKLAILID